MNATCISIMNADKSGFAIRPAVLGAVTGLLAGLFFCLTASATGQLQVTRNGDAIDLSAYDVPLNQILQVLARTTGISIDIEGSMEEKVTLEVSGATLDQVLQRLLTNCNYSVVYRRETAGQSAAVEIRMLSARTQYEKNSCSAETATGQENRSGDASSQDIFRTYRREALIQALSDESSLGAKMAATPVSGKSLNRNHGIRIDFVNPDSVFNRLGMKTGDRVNNVNRRQVRSVEEIVDSLRACLKEGMATIRIERILKDGRYDPLYLKIDP